MRSLVVNADDLGLSPAVNRGIAACRRAGLVRSASLLVNLRAFEDGVATARAGLGVGLHLNLTCGRPVSPAHEVPSLVDGEGRFHAWPIFAARALAGLVDGDEVRREARRQLARLESAGLRAAHLDAHEHVHALPVVFEAAVALVQAARIPFLRRPVEAAPPPGVPRGGTAAAVVAALFQWTALGRWPPAVRSADRFHGISWRGREGLSGHVGALVDALEPGVTELVVHPGFLDDEAAALDPSAETRAAETAALADPSLAARAAARGVRLTSFEGLSRTVVAAVA